MKNYRARGITKDGKPIFDETHEHVIVADWLTLNGIFFIHVPNEGKRTNGAKLKRMGMLAGVVDFLIFDPPPRVRMSIGAALELKALDGKVPTAEQFKFIEGMGIRHYETFWCRGAEDAIEWLSKYCGYGRRNGGKQ